jgi:outer membrane lipoprotein-sorting protein
LNRRALLLALPLVALRPRLALAQAAVLTLQDRSDLARVEAYINSIHTLKARFLQVAPDGGISQGLAWLQRPGRMRFQYDPPTPLLLVAGHGLVVFYDRQLGQTTNIPLGATPLGILLRENFSLTGEVTVTAVARQPGQLQVTLLRTASPGDGTLTLVFSDPPLALHSWAVVDAQRQETQVTLLDVQLGGTFDPQMFSFIDPKFLPGGNKDYR